MRVCTGVSNPCHAGRINLSGWCFRELRICTTCQHTEMEKEGLPPLNISLQRWISRVSLMSPSAHQATFSKSMMPLQ